MSAPFVSSPRFTRAVPTDELLVHRDSEARPIRDLDLPVDHFERLVHQLVQ